MSFMGDWLLVIGWIAGITTVVTAVGGTVIVLWTAHRLARTTPVPDTEPEPDYHQDLANKRKRRTMWGNS